MTFEGTISLSGLGFSGSELGKAAAGIIGRGGSGISVLTTKFPGLFVKVYDSRRGVGVRARAADCDTIYISGRNQEDVTAAATVIVTNARAVVNGTPPSGPQIKVTCPSAAVASVIGKGGNGLRKIQNTAGDYCHIHYNRDDELFEITAQTQAACDRAKIYIGQAIRDFMKPKQQVALVTSSPRSSYNFQGLEVEGSDSEDESTEASFPPQQAPQRSSSDQDEESEGKECLPNSLSPTRPEMLVESLHRTFKEFLGGEYSPSQELINDLCDLFQGRGASASPATESTSPPDTAVIETTAQAPAKPKRRKKLTLVAMNQPVF
jgi:hypothetical protein